MSHWNIIIRYRRVVRRTFHSSSPRRVFVSIGLEYSVSAVIPVDIRRRCYHRVSDQTPKRHSASDTNIYVGFTQNFCVRNHNVQVHYGTHLAVTFRRARHLALVRSSVALLHVLHL